MVKGLKQTKVKSIEQNQLILDTLPDITNRPAEILTYDNYKQLCWIRDSTAEYKPRDLVREPSPWPARVGLTLSSRALKTCLSLVP